MFCHTIGDAVLRIANPHHTLARYLMRCILLAILLALLSPASMAQPTTGSQQTVVIDLREGVNLVALPVVPTSTNMNTVVAGILSDISLVQDDKGRHLIPELDIHDIAAWHWKEAYKIHAKVPATLVVRGATLTPEASPLVLEGGAHWIPYLRNTTLAVDEALATILPSLSRVEDEDGRVYEPGNGSSTLDSLRAGNGYRVWLTARDTLYYPANADGFGGGGDQAATLAQALALRGMQEGDQVNVLGYYAPNDGGGGLFRVTNSGAMTDGGLVHALDEHASAPVTEVIANDSRHAKPFSIPAGARIVHGSVTVELLRPNGNRIASIDGRYLHGHEWVSRFLPVSLVNYKRGEFNDRRERLAQWCEDKVGDMWACDVRVTYRYTTSDLRLERLNPGATLNAHWFGARPHADDPTFDNQPVLGHVINVANRLNKNFGGTITTILLPKREVYEYSGSLQLGPDLTLKGAGGTELATVTNDVGLTYQPVRIKQNSTRLRVKAGKALAFIRMEKSENDPNYLQPDLKHRLHGNRTAMSVAPGAFNAGLADIVLDGNWEQNRQAFEQGWSSYAEKETAMRNTPGWSGFVSTIQNNVEIPIGQVLTLRNVAILGYGATGVLGNVNNTWDAENVLLGNSVWNHALYGTNGVWRNLTFSGFSWSHGAFNAGEIHNMVFEDGTPGPFRPGEHILGIRGGDVYSEVEMTDPDDLEQSVFIRSDGSVIDLGVTIDGFHLDLRGSELTAAIGGYGPRIHVRNGVVIMDEGYSESIFREKGNGYQKALYPDYQFENIRVYDHGEERGWLFRGLNVTESTFRNVTTDATLLGPTEISNRAFDLHANWRDHFAWNEPQTVTFTEMDLEAHQRFIGHAKTHRNAVGTTYYITNSSFNNRSNTLIVGDSGTGELDRFDGDVSKLDVLMDGVEFKMHNSYFQNLELFFALARLRNCTDSESGHTSESAGSRTYTASGGETHFDTPTNLLWEPLAAGFTSVQEGGGASGLYASHEYVSANGSPLGEDRRGPYLRIRLTRPLQAGEVVTFLWDAAVRPWDGTARPETSTGGATP